MQHVWTQCDRGGQYRVTPWHILWLVQQHWETFSRHFHIYRNWWSIERAPSVCLDLFKYFSIELKDGLTCLQSADYVFPEIRRLFFYFEKTIPSCKNYPANCALTSWMFMVHLVSVSSSRAFLRCFFNVLVATSRCYSTAYLVRRFSFNNYASSTERKHFSKQKSMSERIEIVFGKNQNSFQAKCLSDLSGNHGGFYWSLVAVANFSTAI